MKIPIDSPQTRAARGIITAVRNAAPEGVGFDGAVLVHTRDLDRQQLLEVLAQLLWTAEEADAWRAAGWTYRALGRP